MGKDSELAATLSQRKPVIAYVPKIDVEKHKIKISHYPLDYFKLRYSILQAEGIFEDKDCKTEIESLHPSFTETFRDFQNEYYQYRCKQPFTLFEKEEEIFKVKSKLFKSVCSIIAIADFHSYEKRAKILKEIHPLSIQVHLESGVANGVLVARSIKECAEILFNILTNSLDFTIKRMHSRGTGVTILNEKISDCPFRVVTDNEKLTNSFWNFYIS
jgi:hypothetical protein